jgi:hypothetical protein
VPRFHDDVAASKQALAKARVWGRLGAVFTLGLWSNNRDIKTAESCVEDARQDEIALAGLLADVVKLHAFLDAETVDNGVRVARCIFPDVALDGRQTYGPYWKTISQSVLVRDDYCCRHGDGTCNGPLQIHHIRPLSRGGTNDLLNLLTLCRYHHGLQHPGNPHFQR